VPETQRKETISLYVGNPNIIPLQTLSVATLDVVELLLLVIVPADAVVPIVLDIATSISYQG
jgi:hypothetical protein